jgi:hypothetical protein
MCYTSARWSRRSPGTKGDTIGAIRCVQSIYTKSQLGTIPHRTHYQTKHPSITHCSNNPPSQNCGGPSYGQSHTALPHCGHGLLLGHSSAGLALGSHLISGLGSVAPFASSFDHARRSPVKTEFQTTASEPGRLSEKLLLRIDHPRSMSRSVTWRALPSRERLSSKRHESMTRLTIHATSGQVRHMRATTTGQELGRSAPSAPIS